MLEYNIGAFWLKVKFEKSILSIQKFKRHDVVGGAALADFLDALANFLAVALHAFEPILTEVFQLLA